MAVRILLISTKTTPMTRVHKIVLNWTQKEVKNDQFIYPSSSSNFRYSVTIAHPKGTTYIGSYNQKPKAITGRNAAIKAFNAVYKRKPYKSR